MMIMAMLKMRIMIWYMMMEFKSKHMVMMWISSTAFLWRQMQSLHHVTTNTLATSATDGWGGQNVQNKDNLLRILGSAIWTQELLGIWHQHPVRPVDQVEEGEGLQNWIIKKSMLIISPLGRHRKRWHQFEPFFAIAQSRLTPQDAENAFLYFWCITNHILITSVLFSSKLFWRKF